MFFNDFNLFKFNHLHKFFKSMIVELRHQIVELLQIFKFIFKSFFIKTRRYIFAM